MLGLLVVLGLDLDDDVVALRKAGIAASLEALATWSTGVGGLEGRTLALVLGGADERLELLHGGRCLC